LNPISQLVVEALWVSFSSLPPKEAMVALVVTDIIRVVQRLRRPWVMLTVFSSIGMTLLVERCGDGSAIFPSVRELHIKHFPFRAQNPELLQKLI